ncbi:MAG: T9SS type A sorting domain-containing protein [Bacteroidota bacterium]
MIRKLTLFFIVSVLSLSLKAQPYDTLSIQDIQMVSQANLLNCVDSSFYRGDTVVVMGTVVMDALVDDPQNPGQQVPSAQAAGGRNIWIQSGTGPFSGIDLFTDDDVVAVPVPGTDVLDLTAGDSVAVTGIILEFGFGSENETEIIPINIDLVDIERPVFVNPVSVGDLNDDMQVNQFETGEQWEGTYVELTNLRIERRSTFSNGTRVSLICSDQDGNLVNISDRFLAARLSGNGGTFVPPPPSAVFDTIRGVVVHSPNGCTNDNGRGYEIFPFKAEDYVVGISPPIISGANRNPITPTETQDVNVFASIEDPDGNVISASLFYAVGASNTSFLEVPMSATGNTYTAMIPNTAFSDGNIVKYYISATDDSSLVSNSPPSAETAPFFFAVNNNGTSIRNVQFTPFENGNSGYTDLEVSVSGIVTASAQPNDLGFVYIQQPGEDAWAGLSLVQNAELSTLRRGDSVTVTGQIQESFGLTRMVVTDVDVEAQGANIPAPVRVDPDLFTNYDFALNEQYEAMLVELASPTMGSDIFVVETNADGPPNNFAEYRVGSSDLTVDGSRVLAGRVTNNAFSSLSFSIVNDSSWTTESGVMTVDPCVVTAGDTISSLIGIMYYSFGNMKLLPRNNSDAVNFRGANCSDGVVNSIEDELAGSEIIAYPNPNRDQLTVSYSFPQMVEGSLRMIDLMGRTVAEKELRGIEGELQLNTSRLIDGTYIMLAETQGYIISRKRIIVQQ